MTLRIHDIHVFGRTKMFLTICLSLPDSVRHSPQSGKHEEDGQLVRIRPPVQESDDAGEVAHGS